MHERRHGTNLRAKPASLLLATALAAFAATAIPHGAWAEPAEGGSFFDGFDRLDTGRWYVSDGWANGDWQNCVWSGNAVDLSGGILHLRFLPGAAQGRDFICGEIQSTARYGYGTYEARFRTPAGSGLNAAFFTYIGPAHDAPHHEIDFEVLTRDTGSVSLNTYVDGKPKNGATAPVPATTDGSFNTYSFTWEPDRLRWYVNGKLVHEAQGPQDLPAVPQKIFASLWGSDTFVDWMGPFVAPEGPLTMEVDWIAFTALGEGCGFEGSVLCTEGQG